MNIAVGDRFGRLVVISPAEPEANKYSRWHCRCDCGKETIVRAGNLKSGNTQSCGCNKRRRPTHGDTIGVKAGGKWALEYEAWSGMIQRCTNPRNHAYPRYGGRGITVCAEWQTSYEAFLSHIGRKPGPKYTLERIDNSRGYEPGNVRWATRTEQARNRRTNRLITVGNITQPLAAWAELLKVPPTSLCGKLNRTQRPLEELYPVLIEEL